MTDWNDEAWEGALERVRAFRTEMGEEMDIELRGVRLAISDLDRLFRRLELTRDVVFIQQIDLRQGGSFNEPLTTRGAG